MGFFSWNCRVCGKSATAQAVSDRDLCWRNQIWVVMPPGDYPHKKSFEGAYDGYGRVYAPRTIKGGDEEDIVDIHTTKYKTKGGRVTATNGPDVYHVQCLGKTRPRKYRGGSSAAEDQGYFL